MDSSRLLILIFLVITTSESSEPQCEQYDKESYNLLEGEAFYFVHASVDINLNDEKFTWSRKNSQTEEISTDENEMIHYHGSKLFFLNLSMEDSGIYTARNESPPGKCYSYPLKIEVFKASNATSNKLLYRGVKNSDQNKRILCPEAVSDTCVTLNGEFTWKKDSKLLEGQHENDLWVFNATKDKEGIYTCICTWKHNQKVYTSSGSRRLETIEQVVHFTPEILSPTNKEEFADEGVGIKLICSVFCGYNVKRDCNPSWYINGIPLTKMDAGYNMTKSVTNDSSNLTISSAVLTIEKVSAKDFQSEFKCVCVGFEKTVTMTLTLKPRESIIPLVMGGVCVLFFCVFFAALVKCFAIDLALFFRPYIPQSSRNKDARVYDAYVVYQMQSMDKVTEDTLCQFVTRTLPSVLEEKCGYRLFIHGRDDIPGEDGVLVLINRTAAAIRYDRLELVEDRMKQSRRLMIILSPGPESGSEITDKWPASPQISMIGGFDWQVGLHHALVQREISVILIQLGDTGPQGYTHLPLGLQHLIRKSAPIRWPEGSRGAAAWNSRFWKRVRYLMPATPAKKYLQSAIV